MFTKFYPTITVIFLWSFTEHTNRRMCIWLLPTRRMQITTLTPKTTRLVWQMRSAAIFRVQNGLIRLALGFCPAFGMIFRIPLQLLPTCLRKSQKSLSVKQQKNCLTASFRTSVPKNTSLSCLQHLFTMLTTESSNFPKCIRGLLPTRRGQRILHTPNRIPPVLPLRQA